MKIPVTNHAKWVCHFHLNSRGTPLTVYRMSDGTFEVWYGKSKKVGLSESAAATILGRLLMAASSVQV